MRKIVYLEYLRVIACFSVIILHICAACSRIDIGSINWNFCNIYNSLTRFCVPTFVMITGALLLNPQKKISTKKILTTNIKRIIVIYTFWSLFYTLFQSNLNNYSLKELIIMFMEGYYHLWYLYMLVGLYLIIPFFKKIVENKDLTKYFLILGLIFTFIIPELLTHHPFSLFIDAYENTFFYFTLGFGFYLVLGHYLHNTNHSNKVLILWLLASLGTILLTKHYSTINDKLYINYYNYFSINVLIQSYSVFILGKNIFSKFKNLKLTSIIFFISKYTFGIYLIHAFFIKVLSYYFDFTAYSFNSLFSVPILSLLVFILSLITCIILNKISLFKKYLI